MSEPCTVKACVACGKILNGHKRMKDSHGHYWCVECGKHDQQRKPSNVAATAKCDGCGDAFPTHQLSKLKGKAYCIACSHAHATGSLLHAPITEVFAKPRLRSPRQRQALKVLVTLVLLACVAWRFYGH